MSRYLALWLPEFSLQAIVFAGAAPVVPTPWAVLSSGPGAHVLATSTAAQQQGVGAGQSEAEARVHCPTLLGLASSLEAELHLRVWLEARWDGVTPRVQALAPSLWLGDLLGLERLLGPALEQARRLRECLRQRHLDGRIGLSQSSSAAVLAAFAAGEKAPAVWLLEAGREARELARLPLAHLQHFPFAAIPPSLRERGGKKTQKKTGTLDWLGALDLLHRWGLKTLGDLARLPANGLAERLGRCGIQLQALARGEECGLLEPVDAGERRLHLSLEWDPPEHDHERLLAALRSRLQATAETLEQWDRVVERITLALRLAAPEEQVEALPGAASGLVAPSPSALAALLQSGDWRTTRRLLTPVRDLRSLLQHMEAALATRPKAAVAALTAAFDLAVPRHIQPRLFGEADIDRDKLERVMDKLKEILHDPAGRSFGCPQLLDSHHPDAFRLCPFMAGEVRPAVVATGNEAETDSPRLALAVFRFRPPHPIELRLPRPLAARSPSGPGPPLGPGLALRSSGPATLLGAECHLPGVAATLRVIRCAGPWRSSGDWWTPHAWSRDEWDVELSNRGLYVLVHHRCSGAWVLEGQYE